MFRRGILVATLLICCAVPRVAVALDEGDWQVGVTPILGLNTNGKLVFAAGGLRLEGRYGLTDVLSTWAAVDSLFAPGFDGLARTTSASAGMSLAFNVLRWVPFVDVGVTALDLAGVYSARFLGGEVGAGAEYLVSPTWSIAPVARLQYFPVQLSGPRNDPGLLITLGVRLGRTF